MSGYFPKNAVPSKDITLAAVAKARAGGFIVHESAPDLLLLDFDSKRAWRRFLEEGYHFLTGNFDVDIAETWRSKSGNRHVKVYMEENMETADRLMLQAALGSDPKREMLGLILLRHCGMTEPSFLFQPKKAKVKEIYDFLGAQAIIGFTAISADGTGCVD